MFSLPREAFPKIAESNPVPYINLYTPLCLSDGIVDANDASNVILTKPAAFMRANDRKLAEIHPEMEYDVSERR